jgi:hypothetical protein
MEHSFTPMAGSEHIKPLRLFDLSRAKAHPGDFEPTEEENQHLRGCDECQNVLAVFSRQFSRPQKGKGEGAA